jgi:Asp-tRNA(Asn)/Glu-tRNA(Gln) amidotransferase A subunit family amidase
MSHEQDDGLDRRSFIKTGLTGAAVAAGAGAASPLALAAPKPGVADKPLTELAAMLRRRKISATELCKIYLDRIAKYGGRQGLNAYITVARESALKQAARLDRLAKRGKFVGPLHGLPIAVKDNLDTAGIRTTGGSKILLKWVPPRDANAVARLKNAGAIILGKTNMHEFAFGITTNNPHYGPTRNPYDKTRIPGGSSGGSAAAAAAALCAGAVGSDTGGSVRIPASLCGVVGLKPTLTRVGRGGLMYLSYTRDCIGPITRTVADAALMLQVMAGADPRDPECSRARVPQYARFTKISLRGKRFGLPKKYFWDVIHPDTARTMNEAVAVIKKLGGTVTEVEVKDMNLATPTGFAIVLAECIYLMEDYLKQFDPKATIDKYLSQLGPDVKGILGSQKGTPKSKPVPGYVYTKAVRKDRNTMIAAFARAMKGVDALLLPTTPLPAAKIGEDVTTPLAGKKVNTFLTFIRTCDPVSVVGYPAITVPAGYSRQGLPIGLQIVGRPFDEMKLLGLAYAFEKATKVRKPPKL